MPSNVPVVLSQCCQTRTSVQPPLGLGYLAAVLQQGGHAVVILNPRDFTASPQTFVDSVRKHRPEIVGLSFLTPSLPAVRDWVRVLRVWNPEIAVVLGGPHVTALPEHTLRYTGADYAVLGEGETVFRQLVGSLTQGSVGTLSGVVRREALSDKVERAPLIEDLDSIPFPAWDLIKPERYPPTPHGAFYNRFPIAPIITTRGCPFDCSFCASKATWHRRLRCRGPESVVNEIEYLARHHGVREIHFEDDNLTSRKDHIAAICEGLLSRDIDMAWTCPNGVRIDSLDRDLLRLMHRSGCYMLGLGIETANQSLSDAIGKRLDLSCLEEKVFLMKEIGIKTYGFFLFGLPGETRETAQDTIDLACRLPFDQVHFGQLVPLPGSRIFTAWLGDRDLDSVPWDHFDYKLQNLWRTDALSAEEIARLRRKAWSRFYLRPRPFLRMVSRIRPRQIPFLVERLITGRV